MCATSFLSAGQISSLLDRNGCGPRVCLPQRPPCWSEQPGFGFDARGSRHRCKGIIGPPKGLQPGVARCSTRSTAIRPDLIDTDGLARRPALIVVRPVLPPG